MRKYSVLTATISALLLALISTPANASVPADGTYLCTTGNFTISSVGGNSSVTTHSSCAGAVVIPAGVTSIGASAFYNATALTSITIPASVTSIGTSAIRNATALTSITFAAGSTLTSIGNYAFRNATSLTSITIPASVTSIGNYAFQSAIALTSVTFAAGSTLTSIGDGAFYSATSLTSITIPASVTSIGIGAFYSATSLTSITIPASVTSIGDSAFYGTIALTSVTFAAGSTLASIGANAFALATSLTSITIPASVTSIGANAFYGTTALTSVYFLGDAPTAGSSAFTSVAAGAKAYIETGATGFGSAGKWHGLVVEVNVSAVSAPIVANAYRADKLATVYFSPLSSKLSKAAKKQLEAAVIANPSAVYKITGHVQKSIFAKNAKNDASLSLARAKAIETHLASLGAGVTFTVVTDAGKVPVKNGKSKKARRATLYAMTPVVQ